MYCGWTLFSGLADRRRILAGLILLAGFISPGAGQGQDFRESPAPLSIVGKLYTGDVKLDRGLAPGSIRCLAAWNHYLYVALIDRHLDHLLDVWDIQDPSNPRLIETKAFGNVLSDPFTFTPVALAARNGTILLEANGLLYIHRQRADGRLELISERSLLSGFGVPTMQQLSFADTYASHLQQVIPNHEVGTVPDAWIHDEVFVNLTDPANPFLVRGSRPAPRVNVVGGETPLNTIFEGMPASVTFDAQGGAASLVVYRPELDQHLDRFWGTKLNALFRSNSLSASLDSLVRRSIAGLDLTQMNVRLVDLFVQGVALDPTDLAGLIQDKHPDDRSLVEVLANYGISPHDSVQAALEKLVGRAVDAPVEMAMARSVYPQAIQAWLDTSLAIPAQATGTEYAGIVRSVFDTELNSRGVMEYLTVKVISPMLGDPDFMRWRLRDLVDDLAQSTAASVVDETLTWTGAGAIDEVLGFIDIFAPLPNCARFPRSARELINTALLEDGAELDLDGYAWFELLKYYGYVRGDSDYGRLVRQADERLRGLHAALADDFFQKLSGVTAGVDGGWDAPEWLSNQAAALPCRQIIAGTLAGALSSTLSLHGFDPRSTVEQALSGWGLPLEERGLPRATVGDLLATLRSRGVDGISLPKLFQQARLRTDDLALHVEQFLRQHLRATLGADRLEMSLEQALREFIGRRVELTHLGESVHELVGAMLRDASAGISFSGYITSAQHAFEGDCIAQWLIARDIAQGATVLFDGSAAATAASEALKEGYRMAADYCVHAMLGQLARVLVDDLSESYSSWTSQLAPAPYGPFALFPAEERGRTMIRQGWAWKDRVGFVLQTRPIDDPIHKRVTLVLFRPGQPEASLVRHDLGLWDNLDYAHFADGALYLGGNEAALSPGAVASQRVVIIDMTREPFSIQRLTGPHVSDASVATHFLAVNEGAHFALAANDGVLFLPNAVAREVDYTPRPTPRFVGVNVSSEGLVRLVLQARLGASVRIDFSTDLRQWMPLGVYPNLDGRVQFQAPQDAGGQRYYRAMSE